MRLHALAAARSEIEVCKNLIEGGSSEGHLAGSQDKVERNTLEVSSVNLSEPPSGTDGLQRYREEILDAYGLVDPSHPAEGNESTGVSKLLLELFEDETFSTHFHKAMIKVTEAEELRFSQAIETLRNLMVGSRFSATTPAVQTIPHTPPASTYNPTKQPRKTVGQMISDHGVILLDEGMFYFSFGIEVDNIHPDPFLQEVGRVVNGGVEESKARLVRWVRAMTGLTLCLVLIDKKLASRKLIRS